MSKEEVLRYLQLLERKFESINIDGINLSNRVDALEKVQSKEDEIQARLKYLDEKLGNKEANYRKQFGTFANLAEQGNLEEDIDRLENEIQSFSQLSDNNLAAITEERETIAAIDKEVESLRAELASLGEQLSDRDEDEPDITQEISQRLQEVRDQIRIYTVDRASREETIRSLEQRTNELSTMISEREKTISDDREKLAVLVEAEKNPDLVDEVAYNKDLNRRAILNTTLAYLSNLENVIGYDYQGTLSNLIRDYEAGTVNEAEVSRVITQIQQNLQAIKPNTSSVEGIVNLDEVNEATVNATTNDTVEQDFDRYVNRDELRETLRSKNNQILVLQDKLADREANFPLSIFETQKRKSDARKYGKALSEVAAADDLIREANERLLDTQKQLIKFGNVPERSQLLTKQIESIREDIKYLNDSKAESMQYIISQNEIMNGMGIERENDSEYLEFLQGRVNETINVDAVRQVQEEIASLQRDAENIETQLELDGLSLTEAFAVLANLTVPTVSDTMSTPVVDEPSMVTPTVSDVALDSIADDFQAASNEENDQDLNTAKGIAIGADDQQAIDDVNLENGEDQQTNEVAINSTPNFVPNPDIANWFNNLVNSNQVKDQQAIEKPEEIENTSADIASTDLPVPPNLETEVGEIKDSNEQLDREKEKPEYGKKFKKWIARAIAVAVAAVAIILLCKGCSKDKIEQINSNARSGMYDELSTDQIQKDIKEIAFGDTTVVIPTVTPEETVVEEEAHELTDAEIDEIARQVIKGKFGNGEERKKNLEAAGYDYDLIQQRVNEIVKAGKGTTKDDSSKDQTVEAAESTDTPDYVPVQGDSRDGIEINTNDLGEGVSLEDVTIEQGMTEIPEPSKDITPTVVEESVPEADTTNPGEFTETGNTEVTPASSETVTTPEVSPGSESTSSQTSETVTDPSGEFTWDEDEFVVTDGISTEPQDDTLSVSTGDNEQVIIPIQQTEPTTPITPIVTNPTTVTYNLGAGEAAITTTSEGTYVTNNGVAAELLPSGAETQSMTDNPDIISQTENDQGVVTTVLEANAGTSSLDDMIGIANLGEEVWKSMTSEQKSQWIQEFNAEVSALNDEYQNEQSQKTR